MAEHWHALSILAQWLVIVGVLFLIRRCNHKTDVLAQDKRRKDDFAVDQEKFATQRGITYTLIAIFASVVAEVLWRNVETERSTVLQTVINLVMLAVGYWLGASKQGTDQAQAMSKLAEKAPEAAKEAKDDAKAAADKTVAIALGNPIPQTQPAPDPNAVTPAPKDADGDTPALKVAAAEGAKKE